MHVALQLIDSFLLDYHVGHALVLLFGLSVIGVVPLGSRRALSLILGTFGLVFLVTPLSLMANDPLYLFFGVALLLVAPLLYAFSDA
ncbi:MAG: hypothetical protein V5A23_01365 [Halobacteriales archaeon]